MAAFCKFYGYTPAMYRTLTLGEFNAMTLYMNEYTEGGQDV